MALSEQQNTDASPMDQSDDAFDSDDSEEDPTFDILEETQSSFSRLSIKKKFKSRTAKEMDEDIEGEQFAIGMVVVPELDEKDQKSYDMIQNVIEAGQVENLKVDQCKIYLRKHGLRLTGTKGTLIQRIKEHLDVLNDGGEKKYPVSTFVVNCKGDACTGDVVLFEQNVYEMFNIASKSANGPPCGTRVIAGRIVKESYGVAKQQHTFTIEVLWSKGEKPLPPLHPLLIKGRNLYRLKTMRQQWEDEGKRQKVLTEKHSRGFVARSKREARVEKRKMLNMPKSNRVLSTTDLCRKQEGSRKQTPSFLPVASKDMVSQPQQQPENMQDTTEAQNFIQRKSWHLRGCKENNSTRQKSLHPSPVVSLNVNARLESLHLERQPLTSMNYNLSGVASESYTHADRIMPTTNSVQGGTVSERPVNHNSLRSPLRHANQDSINFHAVRRSFKMHNERSPQKLFYHGNPNLNPTMGAKQVVGNFCRESNFYAGGNLVPGLRIEKKQLCRYYIQGRCYYGHNCKYLHEG